MSSRVVVDTHTFVESAILLNYCCVEFGVVLFIVLLVDILWSGVMLCPTEPFLTISKPPPIHLLLVELLLVDTTKAEA